MPKMPLTMQQIGIQIILNLLPIDFVIVFVVVIVRRRFAFQSIETAAYQAATVAAHAAYSMLRWISVSVIRGQKAYTKN